MIKNKDPLEEALKKLYPNFTSMDLHNMIADLTNLCFCCVKYTIEKEKKQGLKIPEKSS